MIVLDDTHRDERRAFWAEHGYPLGPNRACSIGMGGYIVCPAELSARKPVIHTGGAGPCIIVAMLSRNHAGAIAHVAGTQLTDSLLDAIRFIRLRMMPEAPYQIVLSSGSAFTPAQRAEVVETVSQEFGAHVAWLHPDNDNPEDGYSTAILFPSLGRLLLYRDAKFNDAMLAPQRCAAMRYGTIISTQNQERR